MKLNAEVGGKTQPFVIRLDPKEMARDTSGTRAYSLFLLDLAERLPEGMKPSLSLLLAHLDGESYR